MDNYSLNSAKNFDANSDNDSNIQHDKDSELPGDRLRRLTTSGEEEHITNGSEETGTGLSTGSPEDEGNSYSGHPADQSGQEEITPGRTTDQSEFSGDQSTEDELKHPPCTPPDQEELILFTDSHGEDVTEPPSGEVVDTTLPERVDEVDQFATQVTKAAYHVPPSKQRRDQMISSHKSSPDGSPPSSKELQSSSPEISTSKQQMLTIEKAWRYTLGCLVRASIAVIFLVIIVLVVLLSIGIYKYYTIAATLPDVEGLQQQASQFETTRIFDRNGNLLYEILDPNAGRRNYVSMDSISPFITAATIATEDKKFYNHPGFDPFAIMRTLWQNYTYIDTMPGASTITQQLARTLLFSPEERSQRTVQRKAREIVLAAEITRRYSKDEILELYLNEIYYGNLAYGIEAAAETYFNTTADKLSLSQAAFLAGLPQSPSVYDIFTNREVTLRRLKQVLTIMYQLSQEKGCIEVSNSVQPVCVNSKIAEEAALEIENYDFKLSLGSIQYPHWVNYIRSILEEKYGAQTIYRSGFSVYTTLDPWLQNQAEQIVYNHVTELVDHEVSNGALITIHPATGEILVMVGSADFSNEDISGQVNMTVSPRQPGSAIKPLTYTAAFEKGWTPATLLWDVYSEFPPSGDPNDPRPPYIPVNYDERYHGPVTVRDALANSYNIPAVKTLDFVGIFDDIEISGEDGLISFAKRMGISTLRSSDYGLSLTLGGGEVTLLDLTAAFAVFANGGRRIQPVAITRIEDFRGELVYQFEKRIGEQVIRPEHAFLINSILSDNDARTPMFGADSVLNLPFAAAAKTGTTNDFRDNWTVGYTPDFTVGVWVGNADYTPMQDTTGLSGAAPIWAEFMQVISQYLSGGNPSSFIKPAGVVERTICEVSGTEPSGWCPSERNEYFAHDQLPLLKEKDLWREVDIDTWTELIASPFCSEFTKKKYALDVTDQWAVDWIRKTDQGKNWVEKNGFSTPIFLVPKRECREDDPKPTVFFAGINEGQTITSSPLDIYAVVYATKNFKEFRLEYGLGDDPGEWKVLKGNISEQYEQPEKLLTWNMNDIPSGLVTLRIYLASTNDTYAEKQIHLYIEVPTPTPTITLSPTSTLPPTSTATVTNTPTMTTTSTPTQTVTMTPDMTATIQALETLADFCCNDHEPPGCHTYDWETDKWGLCVE